MATMTSSRLDRIFDWILDIDGTIYGRDERERTSWYEGIAITASVQWLVFPWFLAAAAWLGKRPVAGYVIVLALAFYLPMLVIYPFMQRRRVSVVAGRQFSGRKQWLIAALTWIPMLIATAGVTNAYGPGFEKEGLIGAAIGGTVALAATAFALSIAEKRRVARESTTTDLDA
jgi:hypothetical protein